MIVLLTIDYTKDGSVVFYGSSEVTMVSFLTVGPVVDRVMNRVAWSV